MCNCIQGSSFGIAVDTLAALSLHETCLPTTVFMTNFVFQEGMKEAKSNIEFLQILKEPCEKLKTLLPVNIPDIIPTLLQNIRVIWVNSPYFNTR
jgi:Dynein heavy chain, N-terminal region 1.